MSGVGGEADVQPEDPEDRVVGIHEASELLGVPAPTIRSWERRYGLPTGGRSRGRHRRYSSDDLAVLRRMRDETAAGRQASAAAAKVRAAVSSPPQALVAAIIAAARDFDARAIQDTLDRAYELVGLDETVEGVLLPAMRQIGALWSAGRCDVAHEHLATQSARVWLSLAQRNAMPPSRPGVVLLCCGPRDWHTLGLEAFALLLTARGFDCRMLGARTPASSLQLAVDEAETRAVVVVSHLAQARPAAVEAIRAVAGRVPVFYAGGAFSGASSRSEVPGVYLGDRLPDAADRLAAEPYESLGPAR